MNLKLKQLVKNWRVILLVILLIGSFVAISYSPGRDGAAIRVISKDSAAEIAGIKSPDASVRPMNREVITSVNGEEVLSVDDYYRLTDSYNVNDTFVIKTDESVYSLIAIPQFEYITLNETETVVKEIFNKTLNKTQNVSFEQNKVLKNITGVADLGVKVYPAPKSNLKKGLDLQGGTRVIIKPVEDIDEDEFSMIVANLEQRLNVYGLSDVSVTIVKNFQFEPEYIMIEIAGMAIEEIEDLILSQGKFEAKIGEDVIFSGDNNDIVYVGKGPKDSRIESCSRGESANFCRFSFVIRLSPDAAKAQADATRNMEVVDDYLSDDLDLYLDGELVSSLKISEGLKGQAITQISISGSGNGTTEKEAIANSLAEMKKLQTVIEAGSLPSALEIVKSDTISPTLGENFTKNALFVGLISLLTVAIVLYVRYRKFLIIIPMVIALSCEVFLVLGVYAIAGWVLDLAAIAGIIIVVGTGVDHLVVITDEVRKKTVEFESWKSKMKNAFGIIVGAFLTTAFAMVPLLIAGAGLLRGFAITTLTGLVVGVGIVRPTYAKIIEVLLK